MWFYVDFFTLQEMDFRKFIPAEGRVEDWMTSTLQEMRRSNRLITKEAVYNYCNQLYFNFQTVNNIIKTFYFNFEDLSRIFIA